MANYKLRPAKRTASKVLLGFYSRSGAGKTYSALLLGRGLVGPDGRLAMADTEMGRGENFADKIPGGYDYFQIQPPYNPQAFIDAIIFAEKSGVGCLIIDSISHEWEGTGGVLEMAAANEAAGKKGLLIWKDPKIAHQKLLLKMLQSDLHIIVCLRAKRKSRQGKDGQGKTTIIKDEFYTPKQDEDFIYELMGHAELLLPTPEKPDVKKHSIRVTKPMHPDLSDVFYDGLVITEQTGAALADWCKGQKPGGRKTAEQKKAEQNDPKTWTPAGGWPNYSKVRDFANWSRDEFLPKANSIAAQAWALWWSQFIVKIRDLANQGDADATAYDKKLTELHKAACARK